MHILKIHVLVKNNLFGSFELIINVSKYCLKTLLNFLTTFPGEYSGGNEHC